MYEVQYFSYQYYGDDGYVMVAQYVYSEGVYGAGQFDRFNNIVSTFVNINGNFNYRSVFYYYTDNLLDAYGVT
jgi:hypothetical protein